MPNSDVGDVIELSSDHQVGHEVTSVLTSALQSELVASAVRSALSEHHAERGTDLAVVRHAPRQQQEDRAMRSWRWPSRQGLAAGD